ncbi:alpha/beta fold hydrolase [Pseudidiomarina donghaiensis]|uniref:Alpha/beta hydrolase n=1 Tax=Pseudidiomarina donghaiensis TaxID=519452 RepID=A0A432XKA9_9GAMM|nr:alpha/beta hydrolase [Pseudidiomarina donghaiensis]RUO49056.1 alpha/beta hydrolase [Pseudidiomarina donghaiensis]SFV20559.1 Pimeloyl-ACP methyl ester carboxylesterase [Pseudidiomarina donghaiensis]
MQQRKQQDIKQRNCITVHSDQGRPVVFGHGFGCDQLIWLPVIGQLPKSVAPITFDFMGCGRSDFSAYDKEKYGSFNGYVQDLIDVIEALNLGAVDYIGHSVAGMIGMLAAVKRPDLFKQIIAIGPSPKYLNDADYQGGFEREDIIDLLSMMERNHFEWAGYLAPIVMENSQRPELAEQLRKSFANSNPEISRRFAEVLFLSDNREHLKHVPVPVTLMYCAVDVIVPVGVIEYMAAQIPHSKMAELNAAGHYPHVSSPQEVSQAIMAIL